MCVRGSGEISRLPLAPAPALLTRPVREQEPHFAQVHSTFRQPVVDAAEALRKAEARIEYLRILHPRYLYAEAISTPSEPLAPISRHAQAPTSSAMAVW